MTRKQCFHTDEKPAEHRVPRRKTTTQDLAERPCKCIWQQIMKTYLSGIKHRREQPQHGQACEVSLFSINKWSSQNNKLNMHQSGHPGTLRDTKGSGSLKWRHYYQQFTKYAGHPWVFQHWPLRKIMSSELAQLWATCKPVTFSHWNGTKDTGETVNAPSTT